MEAIVLIGFGVGHTELLLLLAIVLIIFGAGKLPKVLGQLGEGVKNFREASSAEESKDGDGKNGSESES